MVFANRIGYDLVTMGYELVTDFWQCFDIETLSNRCHFSGCNPLCIR